MNWAGLRGAGLLWGVAILSICAYSLWVLFEPSRFQFPVGRCYRLTFVLLSGARVVQDVWGYDVKFTVGERVTSTQYLWAGRQPRAELIVCEQIAAFLVERGPYKWRGWVK